MANAKKVEQTTVSIPALDIREFDIRIVGDTPLISHAWDEKAKLMMLQKQMKKATNGREARDPFAEFVSSLYWLSEKPEAPTMDDVMNGKSKEWVKQGLRDGVFPWGYAVKLTNWSYFISSVKFTEYTGIKVPLKLESEG